MRSYVDTSKLRAWDNKKVHLHSVSSVSVAFCCNAFLCRSGWHAIVSILCGSTV